MLNLLAMSCLGSYLLGGLFIYLFFAKKKALMKMVTPTLDERLGVQWRAEIFGFINIFDFRRMGNLRKNLSILSPEVNTLYSKMIFMRNVALLMFLICALIGASSPFFQEVP